MAYYKDEGTRKEFTVVERAKKILEKREKEKREQMTGEAEAERFVRALSGFEDRKDFKKTVLVFENGDRLILNHVKCGPITIFFHENDNEKYIDGNKELTVARDWKLLLKMSERSDVVDIKI